MLSGRQSAHVLSKRRRERHRAFTLIEVMIVVVLLALAAAGTTLAIGALTRTNLRSGCMKIAAACRYAYNRAIVKHNTVRVVLDADDQTLAIEEASGHVTLSAKEDERRENAGEGGAEVAVDPWEAARSRLEKTLEPSFGRSPFGPITGSEGETLEKYQAQPIGDEVRVLRMFLPHETETLESGKGAIYFFPGGMTEHAVIQLTTDGETVYAVEVHPLTGRVRVHTEAYEPENLDEEDFSELEDPG